MYIRCAKCRASSWIKPIHDDESHELSCKSCGEHYEARVTERLGVDPERQHDNARTFAESHQIDLPSAYTVLLGIAPLNTMLAPAPEVELDQLPAGLPEVTGGRQRTRYDPGFQRAVDQGWLTVEQATQRGKREAYAAATASRYRLPLNVAHQVADNELSVREALTQKEEARRVAAEAKQKKKKRLSLAQRAILFVVAAGLFGAVGAYGWMLWQQQLDHSRNVQMQAENAMAQEVAEEEAAAAETASQPAASTPQMASVEVETDEEGRMTRVVGPDPRSVLLSYCERTGHEALRLAPVSPRFSRARLGVFRDFSQLESYFAIHIRRDTRTRRWVAGDGQEPIRRTPIAELPEGDSAILR